MSLTDAETRTRAARLSHLLVQFRILIPSPDPDALAEGISRFQREQGLLEDGIAGPATLWELQQPLLRVKHQLVRLPVRPPPGVDSEAQIVLRADVATQYEKLQAALEEKGGSMTSAGGLRRLSSGSNANRSTTSHHYWAGAFDLALPSGFFAPRTDPFVVERVGTGKGTWRVWARASKGESRSIEATYWAGWNGGKDLTREVHGHFIDFTALAQSYGFYPIGPRRSFTRSTSRSYGGAEWWHFQYEAGLFPGVSQLGIELQKIQGYSPDKIHRENPALWQNARIIFRQSWF